MKTLILMVILLGTSAYSQIANYTSVPPLTKTLKEVVKTEKIDTSIVKYSNGVMLLSTRIDSDSADILYVFDLENRLSSKSYMIYLPGHTGKAALKKYRAHYAKLTAKYGGAEYFERMEEFPTTDQDKLWHLSKGKLLLSKYETDTFYILSSVSVDENSGSYKIITAYISPEEWNKTHRN